MKIEYLEHHPALVPVLAKYNYDQWGRFRENTDVTTLTERYIETMNAHKLPLTLVALDDQDNLLGFASLIKHDMDIRQDLMPWLAALYVLSEYRGQGIGDALVKSIINEANRLHLKRVYLYTGEDRRFDFYLRLGWSLLEKVKYRGKDAVIMQYVC